MPYFGEQKREYDRKYVAARRAAWFKDKICVKCGTTENLENHHLDPSTKVASCVWTWAIERRDAELAKCEVLCFDCHVLETAKQVAKPLVHGTRTAYDSKHHCRCADCVTAASIRREKQRHIGGRKHQASYKGTSGSIGTATHL